MYRWARMPAFDWLLSVAFLAAGIRFWQIRKSRPVPDFISCTTLVALGFAVLVTVAPFNLNPLIPLVPLRARYFSPFLPFAIMIAVYALSTIKWRDSPAQNLRTEGVAALLLVMLLAAPQWYNRPPNSLVIIRPDAFFWRANHEYTRFANLVRNGNLALTAPRPHATKLIAMFRYPLQLEARDGKLGVMHLKPDALCTGLPVRAPLNENYGKCRPARTGRNR